MRKTLFVITLLLALLVASTALALDSQRSADGNWLYIEEGDTVCISHYQGSDAYTVTSITVPTTIDIKTFSKTDVRGYHIQTKTVSGMRGNPFRYCSSLQNIIVAPDSPFVTIDSVLFDQSMQTLICYPQAKAGHNYSVPQGVETIGESAFPAVTTSTRSRFRTL